MFRSAEFKDIGPQMPTDNFVMEDKQAVQIGKSSVPSCKE